MYSSCIEYCVFNVYILACTYLFLYSNFLVNSADRIVRVYDVDDIVDNADSGSEPEALQKLQDLVNKCVCVCVCACVCVCVCACVCVCMRGCGCVPCLCNEQTKDLP